MLKNYIKIAWKVLLRRKFFTFISLFGISFTLMILMVVTAFFDHVFGPQMPERQMDRLLFVNMMRAQNEHGQQSAPPSYYFLNRYVRSLQSPEKVSINSVFHPVNAYVNNQKLALDLKYTDQAFWEILDFDFLEGKPYGQQEVDNASRVAVINQHTRTQYFGTGEAVGQYIEVDQVKYRVIGVVADVPILRLHSYADVWVPVTLRPQDMKGPGLHGEYFATIQARQTSDLPRIKEEYQHMMSQVESPNKDFKELYSYPDTILESFTRTFLGRGRQDSKVGLMYAVLAGLAFLFMLLPTINLVNINISRIMERSSEIGVRKAFGASSSTLIGQFIVENVFLTLLGGLIGFGLAAGALALINDSGVFMYANLGLNLRVFFWGLLLCLVFGLISGVYPAFKMSKLQAAEALKGGNNA